MSVSVSRRTTRRIRAAGAILAALAIAGCTSQRASQPAAVDIRGSSPTGAPAAGAATTATPGADGLGIVTYDTYQTVRARSGDTVTTVATRIGLSATQLGAYNGLAATHQLREGDELALPPRPGGYGPGGEQIAAATPEPRNPAPAIPQTTIGGTPVPEDVTARTVGAAGSETGAPTGWSPDVAEAAIARSSGIGPDGALAPPPSTANPVPPEPRARPQLESPELDQYQTTDPLSPLPPPPPATEVGRTQVAAAPAAPAPIPQFRLQRPVEGPVALGFNKGAGPGRNDGVDFAAPAGARVVAAADGEVALVSESLGGLGTIVLVRHPNELLTVYGRIEGVLVSKGDLVAAGQQIGVVSNAGAPAEPRMHFEVRRGAESLDPMLFLPG